MPAYTFDVLRLVFTALRVPVIFDLLAEATSDADAPGSAVKTADVKRLLVVGGAGSIEVAPGKTLMNTDGFPEAFKAEAKAGARFLEGLRAEPDLDWTFLSPSADFAPGERTGGFRLGGDQLLRDNQGKSHI